MILSESIPAISGNMFSYIMVKYLMGTSHQLLSPLWTLAMRRDILHTAIAVYRHVHVLIEKDIYRGKSGVHPTVLRTLLLTDF
jgi:hypothetical protein